MPKWSKSIEDYLKHIYLQSEQGTQKVGGQQLAKRMSVSHASVTAMLKRLSDFGLVVYEPYQGVALTPQGEQIALEVVRHHRLIESYLTEVLGMSWDEVHDEAEILEHHISERVEELMAAKLGNPRFDPHGHPIPALDGALPRHESIRPLAQLAAGERATVRTVRNEHREMLQFLSGIGIVPDRLLTVQSHGPLGDTLTIVNESGVAHAIGREVAECIDVS